jgi:glycine cleavage system aminomethyltransferase T
VGAVSSGGFSPCLRRGIALAYVKKSLLGEGETFAIEGRRTIPAQSIKGPFVEKGTC